MPDKFVSDLDFQQVLFIGMAQMYYEAAQDGYQREFEDLVDNMVDDIFDLVIDSKQVTALHRIEAIGEDTPETDTKQRLKDKRKRIRLKKRLINRVLVKKGMLGKRVGVHPFAFDPNKLEADD